MNSHIDDDDEIMFCMLCDRQIVDGELCSLISPAPDDWDNAEIVHDLCLRAGECGPDVMN